MKNNYTLRAACMSLLLILALAFANGAFAQIPVSVTGNTNTTPNLAASYTSLSLALTDLNAVTAMSGPVTLTCTGGNSETAPATGLTIGSASLDAVLSSTNTVTINKSGGAVTINAGVGTATAGSAAPDGILKLTGADYITIDGLTFTDGNSASSTVAMEFGVGMFKLSASNGCNNNTIQNCTFNMQRVNNSSGTTPMLDGAVGIEVVNSTSAAATTSLTPTNGGTLATNGTNSNNKFYGNTINGGNIGIGFGGYAASSGVGPAPDPNTFLGDLGNDVGGTSAGTGNIILNYGGGAVTNPAAGIRANNQWSINIQYNNINNNNGSGVNHATTLRGIYGQAGTSANITISNNTITVKGAGTTTALTGIENVIGATASSNTVTITNNIIQNCTYTTATTATFTGILAAASATNQNVNSNQVINNSIGTSGSANSCTFQGIYASASSTNFTANSNTVSGNSIQNSYGTMYCVRASTSTLSYDGNTISNNTIPNNASTSSSSIYGFYDGSSPVTETYTNNNINNLTMNGSNTSTSNIIYGIYMLTASGVKTISGNNINNLTFNSSGAGSASVVGIRDQYASTGNIFKNVVHTLSSTGTTPTVYGILFGTSAGTTYNVYDNLVGNLTASQSTGFNLVGIYCGSVGTTYNVSYNTVYLNATSSASGSASAALYMSSTTPTVILIDNILVNLSTGTTTWNTSALRRTSTTLTAYGSGSNNNFFYAGTPSATNLIYYDGTNSDQTLAAFKARVTPRETASVSETVSSTPGVFFQSFTGPATGTATTFLHLVNGLTTQVESGGITVSGITVDYDNDTRNATTPDIGADEFAGVAADFTAPNISYTALGNSCAAGSRTLTTTITDASGVPTSGVGLPVLYFKINAGSYTASTGSFVSGNTYTFSVGAGSVSGDVVSYYVVAQDNASTPNVGAFPSAGAGGFTANPPAASTPPTTPSSYTNIATLAAGTYTVGAGGTYATLTAAVTDYNTKCIGGAVVFSLTDATYASETFPITINANTGSSATNTLTIKPTGTCAISGSSASALIVLNGADYIIIDGSTGSTANSVCNPTTSASRNLTITNTNAGTSSAVVWLQTTAGADAATNNTVKNCNLVGNSNTTTLFGVGSGSSTISTSSLGTGNSNNSLVNNNISKTQYGIYSQGASAANKNTGTIINQNLINTASPNNVALGGILVGFENGITISGNNISGMSFTGSTDVFGINVGFTASFIYTTLTGNEVTNATISKNIVNSIVNTSTTGFSAIGIGLVSAASGTSEISNNMVSGVLSYATPSDMCVGIIVGGGTATTNIYYNSVSMTGAKSSGTSGGTSPSYALAIGGSTPVVDVRNNILLNSQTSGNASPGKSFAIGLGYSSTTGNYSNLTSNNNDLFVSGAQGVLGKVGSLAQGSGTELAALSNWQTETGRDGASQNILPVFSGSPYALSLDPNNSTNINFIDNHGTPVSVANDIDCDTRSVSTPDIGADEFTVTGCTTATGGTISPSTAITCPGLTYTMSTTGSTTGTGTTYQWMVSNTSGSGYANVTGGSGATTTSYTTGTLTAGTYYYVLNVTCANCGPCSQFSNELTLVVNTPPTVTVSSTPSNALICGSGSVSLTASLSTASATRTVLVQNFAFIPSTMNVNVGDVIHFVWVNGVHTTTSSSVPGGASTWDANINSSSTTFDYTVTTAGAYNYYCVIHGAGQMSGTFTAGSTTYTWSPATGLNSTTGATVTASPTTTTTYTVTGTNGAGCSATGTKTVTVSSAVTGATASASPNPVCEGGTLSLTSSASTVGYTMNGNSGVAFVDISGTGTSVGAVSDDSEHNLTLPFSFNYNGTTYTTARIGNNGVLVFGTTTGDIIYNNSPLPQDIAPSSTGTIGLITGSGNSLAAICANWDDMTTSSTVTTSITSQQIGSVYYIQWTNEDNFNATGSGTITFQIQLEQTTNKINLVYSDILYGVAGFDNGASATVGLNFSATSALQYSYNSASLVDGQSITFTPASPSYSWSGPNSYSSSAQNPSISGVTSANAGVYTMTATNASGCTASASTANVVVNANVTYYADADNDTYGNPAVSQITCTGAPAGYVADNTDCNDNNNAVHPGVAEVCNTIDDNCNGQIDEGVQSTFYADADNDTYGNANSTTLACTAPAGFVSDNTDCDDGNGSVHPGATETCNGIDDNCNSQIDEGVLINFYADTDNDGYGNPNSTTQACSPPVGYVTNGQDCDDTNPAVHFGATEVCNGVDDNCDGQIDENVLINFYADTDNDGFGNPNSTTQACSAPAGYVTNGQDCDDTNPAIHFGATEVCNGVDDNCDGFIDEGVQSTFYADADNDTYGNAAVTTMACSAPSGYVSDNTDCNDNDAAVHALQSFYVDGDNDSYGSTNTSLVCAVTPPAGYSNNNTDCNDANANINPGATEQCNGVDDNCDGTVDEGCTVFTYFADTDNDTYGDPNNSITTVETTPPAGYVTNNTDCNDNNGAVNPGATEVCNTIDDDCDSQIDEGVQSTFYADSDNDFYGNAAVTTLACSAPAGYVSDNTDCNDNNNAVNPGATEVCNTIDDDCDGQIDEGVQSTFYADADNDTYGNASVTTLACTAPAGYVSDNTDCNDGNSSVHPNQSDMCNSVDDDCDGSIDEDATFTTWYRDADGDTYGTASITQSACSQPTGYVADNTDCNDGNSSIHPNQSDMCNSIDDDCDGSIDEDATFSTWYADADNDNYGNAAVTTSACSQPSGYVSNNTDCNDANAAVHPGANEICNGLDDDCDGNVDNIASPVASFTSSCNLLYPGNTSTLTSTSTAGSGSITSYQWRLNGSPISGATNSTYTTGANANGDYSLTVTNSNSCSNTSSVTTLTNLSGALSAGSYTIPSTCGFSSINNAVTYINTNGLAGSVVFNVTAGYTETAPSGGIVINQCALSSGLRSGSTQTVTFQKSGGGTNPKINAYSGTSTTVDGIVKIVGADYITFDAIDVSDVSANTTATLQMEWGYALLKCDGNNGANNNTIKNCVITLNKANTASVGIYSGNHIATSNTGLTYSGGTGNEDASRNGRNVLFGNTISNVYTGISLNGNASASGSVSLNDTLNQIGVIAQAVNSITNFGGLSTAVNAITETNERGLSIDNNNINGGTSSTSTVTGINMTSGVWGTIRNNTITLASSATASTMTGITCGFSGGSAANPNIIIITGNIVQNCSYSTSTSAAFTGITAPVGSIAGTNVTVSSNQVINNTLAGTGTFTGITCATSIVSGQTTTVTINTNTVSGNSKTSTGTFTGMSAAGSPSSLNMNSNTITNNTMTGGAVASTFNCMTATGTTTAPGTTYTVNGNTIRNNGISTMTSTLVGTVRGFQNIGLPINETVTNNTVRKLFVNGSSTGTHSIIGINNSTTTTTNTRTVSGNQVDSLTSAGSATITGITTGTGGTVLYSKNRVFNLIGNGVNSVVTGISVTAGVQVGVYNNYIGDLIAPTATSTNAVIGISNSGATALGLYYNTIRLSGGGGTTFGSSGVSVITTNAFEMRNNIIDNLCTPGSATGFVVAYRRSSTGFTGYTTASNNNLFYAGTPAANMLIHYDGTNSYQTLAAYKTAAATRDQQSVTENVSFASTSPGTSTYLHINTAVATQTESGAVNVTGITDDYDGDVRQGNGGYSGSGTAPDIGADEFNGIANDLTSPIISYTPISGACVADVVLIATISDPSGVPTSGSLRPRIYYNKNSGSYFSQPGTLTSGTTYSGTWSFSIVSSDFGGATSSDVISYFVIAQDNAPTPNIGSNPTGVVATDVNNVSTPPATPNTFTPNATSTVAATATATPSSICNGATSNLSSSASAPNLNSTISNYVFSQSTGTYTPLSGGTVAVSTGAVVAQSPSFNDDNLYAPVSIGFNFLYHGVTFTTVGFSDNGYITFGATPTTSYAVLSAVANSVAPFNADLLGNSTTHQLSYQTSGAAPNRVFTIEWFNWGKYNVTGNEINFQIKLYEGSNQVQFVYQPVTPATSFVTYVGMNGAAVTDFNDRTTTTNWSATTAGSTNTATCQFSNTIFPANGLTFTWNLPLASISPAYSWDPSGLVANPNNQNTATVALNSTQTFTVTVTNLATGCTATANTTVTVGAALTASANSPTICTGQTTTITATPSGGGAPFTYTWSPSTGLNTTTGQTVSANPTSTTTYTVTVLDNCGSSTTATSTVTVLDAPTLSITPSSALYCGGAAASLTASGTGTTYTWTPATGLNTSTGATVNASPASTTTYTVSSSNGSCTTTATVTVTVGPPVTASATASPSSICNGGSSQLQVTASQNVPSSASAYSFAATSGTFTPLSGGTNVSAIQADDVASGLLAIGFTFYFEGVPYTQLYASSNGILSFGAANSSLTNNLSTGTGRPIIAPLWDDQQGANGTASYLTTGSSGNRIFTFEWLNWRWYYTVATPTISYQVKLYEATGIIEFIYRQESTALGGVSESASIGLGGSASGNFLSLNNAGASPTASSTTETTTINTKPANGQVYRFTPPPSAGFTYGWSPATFLNNTSISNPLASSVTSTTTYTATATGVAGCSASATVTVTAGDPLIVSVNSATICSGQSTSLTATITGGGAPFTYAWAPATGLNTTTGQTVSASPTTTTTYTVTVSDNCGAVVSANGTVTVNTSPTVSISANPASSGICGSGSVTLTASGSGNTYTWAPSTGLNTTTGTTVVASPTGNIDYVVTTTAANGCTATASQTVYYVPTIAASATATPSSVCSNSTSQLTSIATVPSSGGYTYSTATYAPVSTAGFTTLSGWSSTDDGTLPVTLPFTFNFYGVSYTTANVVTNGYITFGTTATAYSNVALPTTVIPASICASWDDLSVASATISYGTVGSAPNRIFVISWNNVPHLGSTTDFLTAEILLFEGTNIIEVQTTSNGLGADVYTQGVNKGDGVGFTAVPGRNTGSTNFTNDGVRFTPAGTTTFTYSWSPATFLNNANTQNPVASNVTTSTTYTVTATSSGGCTQTASVTLTSITVPTDPTAHDATQCGFGVPACSVTSTSGLSSPSFNWYLTSTGGSPLSGEHADHLTAYTINSTTTFYVTEFNGTCESNRTSVVETVNQPDQVSATASPSPICAGASTTLTATQAGSTNNYVFTWTSSPSAGSGISGSASGQSVNITPTAGGTYTYTVTAVDGSAGCATIASVSLTVNPLPVITTVTATPSSVCSGGTTTLAVSSLGTGPQTLPATYCVPTQTGSSCVSSVVLNTLNSTPPACVSPYYHINPYSGNETTTLTAGQSYTITLATTGLSIISVWIDYDRSGTFDASEWVQPWTAASSGSATINVPANALAGATGMRIRSRLNANINGAVDACTVFGSGSTEDYTVNIVAGVVDPNVSYVWTPGNLNGATVNVTPPNGTTTYTVTASNSVTGCSSTGTTTVTSGTALVASINSTTICSGQPATLTATTSGGGFPYSYAWSTGATTAAITVSPSGTTTYTVTVTDNCSSSAVANGTVNVNPLPTVTATASPSSLCGSGASTLTASGANTYTWAPSTGLNATTGSSVTANVSSTITYVATGTDANGCANTGSATVSVLSAPVFSSVTATPATICPGGSSQLQATTVDPNSAGVAGYSFTPLSGTFTPLVGGTSVPAIQADDAASGLLPLGFSFNYGGVSYSQVYASSNGILTFGAANASLTNNLSTGTGRPIIAPLWDDQDGVSGVASYLTTGTTGNHVFTFEWLHWEWYYNITTGYSISYQAKLYEATGQIDFIYQQESGPLGGVSESASIGLAGVASGNFLSLNNSSAAPTASSTTETTTINTKPATGQIYRFTPPAATGISYAWQPSGVLNNPAIQNPVASNLVSTTTFTVTATNTAGCSASNAVTVTVADTTFFGLNPDYCDGDGAVLLIPASPGGTFSGPGIVAFQGDYYFDPAASGVGGPFTITYSLPYGCQSSQATTVHPIPTVTLDPFAPTCSNTPPFILTGGSPAGGTYFDQFGYVTNGNTFDPGAAGAGTHTIFYAYSDQFGCSAFQQADITVSDPTLTVYTDNDGDGYGTGDPMVVCVQPAGTSLNNTDCNDNDPTVHAPQQYYVDADNDGYGSTATAMLCSSTPPAGYSASNTDCNDNNASIHPGAPEQCNGIDDNCNGQIDETLNFITFYADADGDGYGNPAVSVVSCLQPNGFVEDNTDCNDNDATVHAPQQYYVDADQDGYGSTSTAMFCSSTAPAGYSSDNTDCNDNDATVHTPQQYYVDVDEDGYGTIATAMVCSSTAPTGYSTNNTDCNDNDATVNTPQQYYVDADDDGYGSTTTVMLCSSTAPSGYSTNSGDCNDANAAVNPGVTEVCANGIDDNCDGQVDENCAVYTYYADVDGDTYGDPASSITSNSNIPPSGYVSDNTDCNDNDASVHAPQLYYTDFDGDGYGSTTTSMLCSSTAPAGYSTVNTDCNDENPAVNPGATDVCNGVDDNCDGTLDENPLVATITPSGTVTYCRAVPVTLTANSGPGISYLWYKGVTLQAGETNSTFTTTKRGSFRVVETTSACYSTSSYTTVARLAIPQASITVYGNTDICSTGSVLLRANNAGNNNSSHTYQWKKGGLTINGATDRLYTATSTGDYTVTVTNSNGCSTTSSVVTVTSSCKGSEGTLFSAQLNLYPNPTNGHFVVEIKFADDVNTEADIQIMNALGQNIYLNRTAVVNGELFDEVNFDGNVPGGNYFVRVIVGDKVYTGKIVFQK